MTNPTVARLADAVRRGRCYALACPACRSMLGPRVQLVPLTCEHCGWRGALTETVREASPE